MIKFEFGETTRKFNYFLDTYLDTLSNKNDQLTQIQSAFLFLQIEFESF